MSDLTGKKFGRLLVVRQDGYHYYPSGKRKSQWLCRCDCGNTVTVICSDLTNAHTQSCGCLRKETAGKLKLTHGGHATRLYSIWTGMKNRCYNPKQDNYVYYGGKGVRVCAEWLEDFTSFYTWAVGCGYRDGLTIDRIDVNGDYCPENCRWATAKEQSLNRTDNRVITYNGKSQSLKEWSDETGIAYTCLLYRLDSGWDVETTLTTPSAKSR